MANRRDAEPSPLRAGAVHTGLSLLVFGGIAGALGAAIILMGDPSEASPKQTLALFDTHDTATPPLKTRFKTNIATASLAIETPDYSDMDGSGDLPDYGPDLGVESPDNMRVASADAAPVGEGDAETAGVRINGKLVKPGESYGDVTSIVSLDRAPIAGMTERLNGMTLPRISRMAASRQMPMRGRLSIRVTNRLLRLWSADSASMRRIPNPPSTNCRRK
jgi:hypothetical protein